MPLSSVKVNKRDIKLGTLNYTSLSDLSWNQKRLTTGKPYTII